MTTTIWAGSERSLGPRVLRDAPLLDDAQVGHIRHIANLSRQPRGDWRHMMGVLPMQEDFSAYRYQLGYMTLALALGHYHQLPAAPVVFRDTFDRLIRKMLEQDVWLYWRDTSTAGGYGPFDLPQLPSRADPVAVDNIMYSAYLQVMTLMNTMLFGDTTYEQPDSLRFDFAPALWGKDRRSSTAYDQRSLNETIYWNMVEHGYLGVPCEPFCVFQMCNQVPILGFRLHDHLYGGATAVEVTQGYLKAWEDFGGSLNREGHFSTYVLLQDKPHLVDQNRAWSDGWIGMLMNTWRPEMVAQTYAAKMEHWLDRSPEGTIAVHPSGSLPNTAAQPGTLGDFGWLAGWASEMGDREVLTGMLRHADTYMNPQWENSGYFYPRHDDTFDADGRFAAMTPLVSNALIPYARLNVKDGLRALYERPWGEEHHRRPALVGLSGDVDVRRAWFHQTENVLQLHIRPAHGVPVTAAELTISPVWSRGDWTLHLDGRVVARGAGGAIEDADEEPTPPCRVRRDGDALVLATDLGGGRDVDIVWGVPS